MKKDKENVWAIVPAAGIGARMSADRPKQYIDVAGKTILEYTLNGLLSCHFIDAIQLCVSSSDEYWQHIKNSKEMQSDRLLPTVEGGETRADSVLAGLEALSDIANDHDWVMVHDAARPCITQVLLTRMYDLLASTDVGGILAVPVADTLKKANQQSDVIDVENTIDRNQLWAAQTPQMFRFGLLKSSLASALENHLEITDEASALEKAGFTPKIVPSVRSNIKVTYPEDVDLVKFYLQQLAD